jgi:hypothetical protein
MYLRGSFATVVDANKRMLAKSNWHYRLLPRGVACNYLTLESQTEQLFPLIYDSSTVTRKLNFIPKASHGTHLNAWRQRFMVFKSDAWRANSFTIAMS